MKKVYYVPQDGFDEESGGFLVSIVEEGKPGHRVYKGPDKRPFVIITTDHRVAQKKVAKLNELIDVSPKEVRRVVREAIEKGRVP